MQIFNIHQAKTNLSQLIEKVLKGQEVIIAKLTPYQEKPRKPGALKGKIFVPDNFDDEDEETKKIFSLYSFAVDFLNTLSFISWLWQISLKTRE